ncbi:MAG: alpha/beta hydrolase [Chloroflexi bacterium]|nr:MAG: alpha/beta hydrolase [Chloroflexota bacterium]
MSIATVDNHLVHYEVLGRGQPILFIHGWLGSWRYWWSSMQGLSAQHRSFAIDLWGFGESSNLKSAYSLSSYIDMLSAFTDHMGMMRPLTLVGHGLGAITALKFAAKHPKQVEKVVAVSLPIQGTAVNERLIDMKPDEFTAKILGKNELFSEVESELRKIDEDAVSKLAEEVRGNNFANDLANCACPVLIVYGHNDSVVKPPSTNNHTQASAGNRYFVGLDTCGHFPMLEANVQFTRLVKEFIHADENVTELAVKEYWQRRVR